MGIIFDKSQKIFFFFTKGRQEWCTCDKGPTRPLTLVSYEMFDFEANSKEINLLIAESEKDCI